MNGILCSYFILRIFRSEFSKSGFVILLTYQRGYFVILLFDLGGIWWWLAHQFTFYTPHLGARSMIAPEEETLVGTLPARASDADDEDVVAAQMLFYFASGASVTLGALILLQYSQDSSLHILGMPPSWAR